MAGTIENLTHTNTIQFFGEPSGVTTAYYGQTFKAGGDHMQSLDFKISASGGPGDTKYHLLIVSVKTLPGGEFQPDQVIKEIDGFTEPFDLDFSLHQVHVNLKGLELVDEQTYAFVLDSFVTRDGTHDAASVGTNSTYLDGEFVSLFLADGLSTRDDHFNADWGEDPSLDLAFKAVFSDEGNTIFGTKKGDRIDGSKSPKGEDKASDFDDLIYGGKGKDKLYGGKGFDYIDGGKGKDKLHGGDDGDHLLGGKGKDKLYGGDGEDCYLFDFKMSKSSAEKNFDKLFAFDSGEDTIYLKQSKFSNLSEGELPGSDTHIAYKNSALYYDGIKFVKFEGSAPTSLDDIHIIVYS